jgi:DNA-binding NtrC family response regulator
MNTSPTSETSPVGHPLTKWILVVDDEPSMRNLIEIVLMGQGWNVRTAGGAEAAMDSIRAASEPPAVVVCDVLMPGVDGLELTRRMCARVPSLSVIFISGHLTDVSWWPSDLREHRFLAKPFENVQLVDAVREALNDATPPPR